MKRIITLLLLLLTLTTTVSAQEVFNELRRKAQATVADPRANDMMRQISQFKIDALDYLLIKMREQMPDSSLYFLDRQAYALNNFMSLYLQALLDCRNQRAAYQVKVIKLFMDASFSNPLFYDPDKELALTYFAEQKSLTRFSLDTDWRRAFIAVNSELKKNK